MVASIRSGATTRVRGEIGVATFILAGGEGRRLFPLTAEIPKPAIPFGPEGRIIDFALENCLASGLTSVAVLTQYRPIPLECHVARRFVPRFREAGGSLALVRAGVGPTPAYPGTADAILANLGGLRRDLQTVLVLAADHVYRMDYRAFLEAHAEANADLTIGAVPVPVGEAPRFGVIEADERGRVTRFVEKPAVPAPLPADPTKALVSMGIYVCRREALAAARAAVGAPSGVDFGRDVIPAILRAGGRVHVFPYCNGAWFDVGTPEALLAATLALYPSGAIAASATVAPGASVRRSVLRAGSHVGPGALVEEAFLLDGAYVGPSARVERAVIGAGARVEEGAVVAPAGGVPFGRVVVYTQGAPVALEG